jgi:hypothetical protein
MSDLIARLRQIDRLADLLDATPAKPYTTDVYLRLIDNYFSLEEMESIISAQVIDTMNYSIGKLGIGFANDQKSLQFYPFDTLTRWMKFA